MDVSAYAEDFAHARLVVLRIGPATLAIPAGAAGELVTAITSAAKGERRAVKWVERGRDEYLHVSRLYDHHLLSDTGNISLRLDPVEACITAAAIREALDREADHG